LWFQGRLVKRWRVPAANQELVLAAFEEDKWPQHLDNPLAAQGVTSARERLRDAIHRLNGCQSVCTLRFHGDGNGLGVTWEPLTLSSQTNNGLPTDCQRIATRRLRKESPR
jgi:hypothetical protein